MALWVQSTSSFRRSSLRSSSCLSGVPQGSVLGPILFLIFINDFPDNIKSSVRLFGEDCVLYRNIHSLQDCLILQEDLDSLGLWEADWQMKFNVAKCHSMRVTQHYSHKQIIHDYKGGSICIENPFITPSINKLGFNVICQMKDQSVASIMVYETLFYLSKFNKLQTF